MNQKSKVLFIDDELNILNSLKRAYRAEEFDIEITDDPEKVFHLLKNENISVLVSDHRMPRMPGTEVLKKSKEISPLTTRMMLTGYADIHASVAAINEGFVYRFLAKPWNETQLLDAIHSGIELNQTYLENQRLQKELKLWNQELENRVREKTGEVLELNKKLQLGFLDSIFILLRLLQTYHPAVCSHSKRIAKLASMIGKKMNLSEKELFQVEVAAVLHDIGKFAIPEKILHKSFEDLTPEEVKILRKHTTEGENLTKSIRGLEDASKIIRHHHEYYDGKGYPDQLSGESIPLGSRILSVVDAFDKIAYSDERFTSESVEKALLFLKENTQNLFDEKIVEKVLEIHENCELPKESEVSLAELRVGMVLSRPVRTQDGKLLAAKGHSLTEKNLDTLHEVLSKESVQRLFFIEAKMENEKSTKKASPIKWG